MPTYRYVEIRPDGSEGEIFEAFQRMSDPPLAVHPESGLPVRRVPTAPNLPLQHGEGVERSRLSNRNLDRLGFTKYEKAGDGVWERKAGKQGPRELFRD
jgi:predicted nucleic acid-binding Zn ribbon protein